MRSSVGMTVAVALLAIAATAHAAEHRDLVVVHPADWTDAVVLEERGVVVNHIGSDAIEAEATRRQQDILRGLGYDIRLIIENIDQVYVENSRTTGTDANYLSYDQFVDTMHWLATNNSDFIKLETLGMSGQSRLLLALKFSDNPQVNENEPELQFEADIHGDEAIGYGNMVEMVKWMAANHGTDTVVTRLIDTREIWMQPLFNPDGYANRRRYNSNNVDLNRNWGWMWGSASSPGPSPMSEPENRASLNHMLRHPMVLRCSYHGGTIFLAYSWSYSRYVHAPEQPHFNYLSDRYTRLNGYDYGQGADSMYPFNGAEKDWDYAQGTLNWSTEIHYTKWPNASAITPTFELNRPGMLEWMHHAGKGIHGTITDVTDGGPVHAQIWVAPADWPSFNCAELGDFHRFYLPGTYDVTFRAPGYRDTTVTGVVVPASGDSAVTVNMQMTPDPAAPLFGFRFMYSQYVSASSNTTYPIKALGPSDDDAFRLDANKNICIDMERPVRDQNGDDLTVYQLPVTGSATVKGALEWTGPWTTIGTANAAQTSFDLSSAGLDSTRFIRLESSGTFYFDAVEGANYTGIAGPRTPAAPQPLALRPIGNPSGGIVRFALSRAVEGVDITIHDQSGREVNSVAARGTSATWNGLDRSGRRVPAGVYFASADGTSGPVRILLAK